MVNAYAPNSADQSPGRLWKILLVLAAIFLVVLVIARLVVLQIDGGIANVLTLIFGFLSWLLLTIGLCLSPWSPTWWRISALAPVVILLVVLSQFRVVRLDGALLPQFKSRWQAAPQLPQASSDSAEDAGIVDDAALQASATDFPQFLGPNRDGVISGLDIASDWNAQPPRIVWKQPIGAGWAGFAVQGSVAVTLEQRDQEQWVSAYNIEDGRLYWHVALPGSHFNVLGGAGPRATPAIDQRHVYAQSALGQVVCIDLGTGKKVWELDLLQLVGWDQAASEKAIPWGRSGSPLIVDELVILPLGGPTDHPDRSLIALSKKDGQVVWRTGSQQISYSSPSYFQLAGTPQIVIVNESSVSGHEVATGRQLWTTKWDGHSDSSASVSQAIPIDDSHLLLSKGYSQGAKLIKLERGADDQWNSQDVWQKAAALKTKFTSAVLRSGFAYGLSDGTLECVRVADGARQWKGGRYGHGQLLLVGDKLLITGEYGELVLVAAQPERHKELAKMQVFSAITWNVPALVGNRLLMRNADEAACVELPVSPATTPTEMVAP